MRILILGANGRIGRGVFTELCRKFSGAEILGAVRQAHFHFEGCTGNTKQHSFVFDPFGSEWKNIGCFDVVINCIGAIEETPGFRFADIHLKPVQQILHYRSLLGNPRIIQVSALGASVHHRISFLRTKAEADELLLAEKNTVVLRPSIVCAPGTMMAVKLRMLRKASRFTFGFLPVPKNFGQQFIQPVMLGDLCAAVASLCTGEIPQRIIPVTGPEKMKTIDLIRIAVPQMKIVPVPEKIFFLLLRIAGRFTRKLISTDQYIMLGEDNAGDNSGLASLTGREPQSTNEFWHDQVFPDPKTERILRQRNAFQFTA